ncbi:hypothetical protein [Pedobacter psychrodurus]|uniref:hypothetical protein n=1 Tax=Pedobacter psychrodurus TaxID=2530456 RepID=UPI00292F9AB3|nr:hypothetical protein [Pedobacter psychrodurus]
MTLITDFTITLTDTQKSFPELLTLSENVNEYFQLTGGSWTINNLHFDSCLIKKKYAFLDRRLLRDAVRKMISSQEYSVLIIKGEPKAGLSYIKIYLSEIESRLNLYTMVDLNLKTERESYTDSDKLLYAAHICQMICEKIGMDYPVNISTPAEFKLHPFLNKLKIFIKGKDQVYLFFLDQFDTPIADDAYALITGLAGLPLQNTKILLVLSGYDRSDNWNFLLSQNANEIDIANGNLSKAHANEFFEQVYSNLKSKISDISFSKQQFLAELDPIIQAADFSNGPNAGPVGELLSKWYKNYAEKFN